MLAKIEGRTSKSLGMGLPKYRRDRLDKIHYHPPLPCVHVHDSSCSLNSRLGKVHVSLRPSTHVHMLCLECICVCRTLSFGVNKQISNSHLTGSWLLEQKAMERAVMSPGVIGVSDLLEDELGVLVLIVSLFNGWS